MTTILDGLRLLTASARESTGDPVAAGTTLLVLTTLGAIADTRDDASVMPVLLLLSAAAFGLQYVLIRRAMRLGGLLDRDAPGAVASFFGLLFVSGVGIVFGLALLILPGIWLYARWVAAAPVLFADRNLGVIEAMDESTRRSRPMMGPILLACTLTYLPYLAALAIQAFVFVDIRPDPVVAALVNLVISGSQILGWYLSVVVYRATRAEPLDAIFA